MRTAPRPPILPALPVLPALTALAAAVPAVMANPPQAAATGKEVYECRIERACTNAFECAPTQARLVLTLEGTRILDMDRGEGSLNVVGSDKTERGTYRIDGEGIIRFTAPLSDGSGITRLLIRGDGLGFWNVVFQGEGGMAMMAYGDCTGP